MKIAFVTPYDARDVTRMSGTGHHISRALAQRGADIHYIGPLKPQYHPVNLARYVWNHHVLGRNDHPQRDPGFLRHYARQVEAALRETEVDVILASGGLPVAYLETDLPLVLWTDCTFAGLHNYYEKYSNLSRRTERNGHACDQNLFDRITRAIFPSQWAADSAVNAYGFDRSRIRLIARGAGVPDDRSRQQIEELVASRPRDRCRLLFIGLDWTRKGGPFAVAVVDELRRRGVDADLTVVGPSSERTGPQPEFVEVLGRIDKNQPDGLRRITELYARSHFFVLPTRAEAFGIVFCEASAFGVPSLSFRTGGVPSAVRDEVNGRCFDLDAPPAAFADYVQRLIADPAAYRRLALSAFDEYRQRLNWTVVSEQAMGVLREAAAEAPGAASSRRARAPTVQRGRCA